MADSGFDTRWDKWRKNGRLATIALVLMFAFWYYYSKTTPKVDRDPIVGNMLWLVLGGWVANIAYGVQQAQQKREDKREERTVKAEDRALAAETAAVSADRKATDANTDATDANTKATAANTKATEALKKTGEGDNE